MPTEEFRALIEAGHEMRNLEFKQPFKWSDDNSIWLREKVIKAVLGFSNTKDGGNIVIGVTENDNSPPARVGLSTPELRSFSYDDTKGQIDSFGSSEISFMVKEAEDKGKTKDELDKMTKELEKKLEPQRSELLQLNEQLTTKLQGNIVKAVEKVAQKVGIDVVLDKQVIIIGGMDISDMVIKELNK